jgi:hypothetical protein
MRVRLVGLAIGAVGLVSNAAPAAAEEVADATCPGPATSSRANGPIANAGNLRFAQTFTAQHSGALTTVQLGVASNGTLAMDWVVQILPVSDGVPDRSATLSSNTIDDATIPMSGPTIGAITAHPSPSPDVTAGQEYAVGVTHPGATSVGVRTVLGDPCPGDFFFGGAAPDPFFPEGSPTGDEMVFAAFVTPAPPAAPPASTQPGVKRKKCKRKKKGAKRAVAAKKKRCKKKHRKH